MRSGGRVKGVRDEELVTLVVDLRGALGRLPTPGEFGKTAKDAGLPGVQSIKRRFGSWESFIAAAPPASDSESRISEPTPKSGKSRP
jgi:hypothetical protein